MSNRTVQQVKALITADLSTVEKVQLIEWLGADLEALLLAGETAATQQSEDGSPAGERYMYNGLNDFPKGDEGKEDELPWEERPWTEEELGELMRPDPKTGAEIAAMIESGEIDTRVWAAMDIPDVVERVNELRRQERIDRGLEGNG